MTILIVLYLINIFYICSIHIYYNTKRLIYYNILLVILFTCKNIFIEYMFLPPPHHYYVDIITYICYVFNLFALINFLHILYLYIKL